MPRLKRGEVTVLLSDSGEAELSPARAASYDFVPRDAHDTYEVCWVIEGQCVLWLSGHSFLLGPQHGCIVRPREVHQLRPTPGLDEFHTLWWCLSGQGMVLSEEVFSQRRYVQVGSRAGSDASAVPLIERVIRELQVRRAQYDLFVDAALLELAARILRGIAELDHSVPTAKSQRTSSYVQWLIQFLETHLGETMTLARLADAVHLSPSYVTTLFRRHTGQTAMAYLAHLRHREGLSLLRNTDVPVAEVAANVGYADSYYFSRVFKAREGCSPLQYRSLFRPR